MSFHWNQCTTPDGRWDASIEVEHFLGDTTTWIYINDAAQTASRRAAKDRVLLYDVDARDVFFSLDGKWLFTIDHGEKVVYHLPTGLTCSHVADRWVVTPKKEGKVPEGTGESVAWPADQAQTWCLKDLLKGHTGF